MGSGGAPMPARTGGDDAAVKTIRRDEPKIGRNDPWRQREEVSAMALESALVLKCERQ